MAVEGPHGPGEAARELVGAHGFRPLVRRKPREGDTPGGREPHRARKDAGVVPLASERQVHHREQPRTADAPERGGGGAERARLVRLAPERVGLGAEH